MSGEKSISFRIDKEPHNIATKQEKIRKLAIRGSLGEKDVAKSKLRRPESLPKIKEERILERTMTSKEKKKEESLKDKYDDSEMKANMINQYGKEKGEKIYFATIRKQAMREDWDAVYDFIVNRLVDGDYALNEEAAEEMIEHFSDEFLFMIAEEYLEEKARGTRKKTTVHAYDVDETLFRHGKEGKPNVMVHVNDKHGNRIKSLTNQEFNTHKLDKDKGHSYDFSEFRSAEKFAQTATPNKKVIKHLKRKIARGENVHLITARDKFDDPEAFHAHLKKHGIHIPIQNIHYTGGMKKGENKDMDIGSKKVAVARAIAKTHKASRIHMYDDAPKVLSAFEKQKKKEPTKKIKTHLVQQDSSGEPTTRSYQATKEEMTAYEYWKQFID